MSVWTEYSQQTPKGAAGSLYDLTSHVVDSFMNEENDGVMGYGVGVVVEVNAETDFVGKNEKFVDFVKGVAAVVAANKPADLDALAGQQVTAPSGTAGKLITSDRWYFAAAVSEEEALRLSKESSVTARFSGSFSQDVPMTLEQVGEAVDGRAVVVLSSNRYLSQITLLRGQTVELIFGSSSGLRIPKAALRMVTQESTDPETGETVQTNLVGVYTLVGGRAEFKPVEILTEESDFYVVSPATEGRAVLRAGDEVIVRATGLYDGKLLNF